MDKNDIVELIARERRVEKLVSIIARDCPAKEDLSQMVYLALLEKTEENIQKAWNEGWINYKIVAIISRQYYSASSPYWRQIGRYLTRDDEDVRPDGAYEQPWWERAGHIPGD